MTGALLLLSWLICWYFFFAHGSRPSSVPVRDSAAFVWSGCLLVAALAACVVRLCIDAPNSPAGVALAAAAALVLAGQGLMVAARRALPLSNYDLAMRLSAARVARGVYAWTWHPMYAGLLLAVVGSTLVMGNEAALRLSGMVGIALVARAAAEHWG
jgi:protein-S-isoprenylcysteine O-methyltransferase Ste14